LNIILDASSSINLCRGGVLEIVLKLAAFGFVFHIGSIVRSECGDLCDFLDLQAASGILVVLPDDTLSPIEFAEILNLYDLGLGETECIALAHQRTLCVCTDDKAARKAAVQHLGADRVLGSLKLIRNCVCQRLLGSQEAFIAYELMKSRGAFLPPISTDYFDC
jgi:predicted nucleic acid-binding protein